MSIEITSTCDRCLAVYYLGIPTIADTLTLLRQTKWKGNKDMIVCPSCSSSDMDAATKYAKITGKSHKKFRPVYSIAAHTWYDFYDNKSGRYGQCRMGANREWEQAPCGESPTILAYRR